MTLLWPRLNQAAAEARLRELRAMDAASLAQAWRVSHPAQTYASTGGARATDANLRSVREVVVDVACDHGYPGPVGDPVKFDRRLAPRLFAAMPMAVGEASARQLWNFVSIVLAPDVTAWRFGFANLERWLCSDRTRHTFARLWWHACLLTTPTENGRDTSLLDRLSESDLNQLLERTSIGGSRPLVRSLARAIVDLHPSARTREVVRDASLRVLRLMSIVDFSAIDQASVDEIVDGLVAETVHIHAPGATTGRAPPVSLS